MRIESLAGLELIIAEPTGAARPTPLLFVHGAFAGAWVWAERFFPLFAAAGYRAVALSLRGHGGSNGHGEIEQHSIRDYVDDVATVVASLPSPPVVLGHSMGGFVVQKYLERHPAPAAVLMSSVPPQGLMASSFHLALKRPGLFVEINGLMGGKTIPAQALREALFAREIPAPRLRAYQERMSIESPRAIWDMTMFNLVWLHAVHRTPLMVLGTDEDQLIPPFLVQSTARAYGVADHIFRGFGHGFMLEPGSEEIAAAMLAWLQQQEL